MTIYDKKKCKRKIKNPRKSFVVFRADDAAWRNQCYGRTVAENQAAMDAADSAQFSDLRGVYSGIKSDTCKMCKLVDRK